MAFSASTKVKSIQRGVRMAVITLADTAGSSTPWFTGDVMTACLQAEGVFGGSTVTFEGSNDGVNFYGLPTAVTRTSVEGAGMENLIQLSANNVALRLMRATLSAGNATTNLTITVVMNLVPV